MRRRVSVAVAVLAAVTAGILVSGGSPSASPALVRHCGGFRYGTDGKQPGPSGITATNVSCWFARATALLGAAPGWHCRLTVGLLFVCPHGKQKVTFYGE